MSAMDDIRQGDAGATVLRRSPLRFPNDWAARRGETAHEQVGSGWYANRFFYLFGEGLEPLRMCLEAWSFVVPYNPERMIVGRNAYGALLVLENPKTPGPTSRVRILDPLDVAWRTEVDTDFLGLLGYWFPNEALPATFLDASVHRAWSAATGRVLALDEMLAVRVPLALGGTMEPDNFQVEDIVRYYETSAPIYAKALAAHREGTAAPPAPSPGSTPAAARRKKRR